MNYIINREVVKKKRKICFAILKTAFDRMDKEQLKDMLGKIGINEQLEK